MILGSLLMITCVFLMWASIGVIVAGLIKAQGSTEWPRFFGLRLFLASFCTGSVATFKFAYGVDELSVFVAVLSALVVGIVVSLVGLLVRRVHHDWADDDLSIVAIMSSAFGSSVVILLAITLSAKEVMVWIWLVSLFAAYGFWVKRRALTNP